MYGEWIRPAAPRAETAFVFLHEGLGSVAQWRDFPKRLVEATGLAGFVYDRRGHGQSPPLDRPRTARYLHEEALDALPAILARERIGDAILIGHSDGGTIALLYGRARAIVTLAAHTFVEERALEGIRRTARAYETGGLKARLERHHGEKTEALFRAWSGVWLSEEFRGFNIEREVERVTCPLLAIQGADDEYGTAAQVESIVAHARGRVEVEWIEGCGHAPHLEAGERVMERVARFVERA
ncbi:MAG: alpha/beta fold hydrolase [Bryobacteraceae bacterium]